MLEMLISGGLTGVIGSVVSNAAAFFKSRQEHEQRMQARELELKGDALQHKYALEQIKAEAEYRKEQLVIESERDMSVAEYAAMAESYKSDKAQPGEGALLSVAEFIRRVTRPFITLLLILLTVLIYFFASPELQDVIARSVVAMSATSCAWWFCDRQVAKAVSGKLLK